MIDCIRLDTISLMIEILYTETFSQWLYGFKDLTTIVRLERRLDKVSRGLFGDVKPLGEGIYEMREHFGAGYRMYYVKRGDVIIVMLGGGDKSSQSKDIDKAKTLAKALED